MGPLIPNDILSAEWNYIIAILIGMAFGYIMEATGFSSSRKLVGVFYGYDFTVLRFFFTAVLTASIGLLFMDYFGWIDFAQLFIYPTYLYPLLVGGLFMGLGFVVGGFCPGTSMCSAAIGKIDAIFFVIGTLIGIFVFSEMFPLLEKFYDSSYLGHITLMEKFNIDPYWTLVVLAIIAVLTFYVTSLLRKKIKEVFY